MRQLPADPFGKGVLTASGTRSPRKLISAGSFANSGCLAGLGLLRAFLAVGMLNLHGHKGSYGSLSGHYNDVP